MLIMQASKANNVSIALSVIWKLEAVEHQTVIKILRKTIS